MDRNYTKDQNTVRRRHRQLADKLDNAAADSPAMVADVTALAGDNKHTDMLAFAADIATVSAGYSFSSNFVDQLSGYQPVPTAEQEHSCTISHDGLPFSPGGTSSITMEVDIQA